MQTDDKILEDRGVRVQVIADSECSSGDRVTSFEVRTHRFTLAEWNTHCLFARNSASSRAIPVTNQLGRFDADPAYPLVWPSEQPGMSGGVELEDEDLKDARALWDEFHGAVYWMVKNYIDRHPEKEHRLHKSLLNRLLEPLQWHTMLITSANYQNFIDLRCSPAAMPEIRIAAEMIKELYKSHHPDFLNPGEYHLPYIRPHEIVKGSKILTDSGEIDAREISSSRCAATSYETQWAEKGYDKEIERYQGLTKNGHWSPLEHVCTPWPFNIEWVHILDPDTHKRLCARRVARLGKFPGFKQWRHVVEARQDANTYR